MSKDKQIEAREKLWKEAEDAVNHLFSVYNSTQTEIYEYDFVKLRYFELLVKGLDVIKQ